MLAQFIIILVRSLVLFGFWILLSGKWDVFHLSIGFFTSLSIAAINFESSTTHYRSTQRSLIHLKRLPLTILRFSYYCFWLLGRIGLAAIHISKLILHPKLPIKPRLIKHKTKLKGTTPRVAFSNSITLTPGTITADIQGDTLTIHQMDEESAGDISNGNMESELARVFKAKK